MFKTLGFYDAFNPGKDLWVLPGCFESFLFKKINWKLKFLLCPPDGKPPEILLIPGNPFPCKNILYLESQDLMLCHKYWKELKKPSLRLFLFEKEIKNLSSKWPHEDLFIKSVHFDIINIQPENNRKSEKLNTIGIKED